MNGRICASWKNFFCLLSVHSTSLPRPTQVQLGLVLLGPVREDHIHLPTLCPSSLAGLKAFTLTWERLSQTGPSFDRSRSSSVLTVGCFLNGPRPSRGKPGGLFQIGIHACKGSGRAVDGKSQLVLRVWTLLFSSPILCDPH